MSVPATGGEVEDQSCCPTRPRKVTSTIPACCPRSRLRCGPAFRRGYRSIALRTEEGQKGAARCRAKHEGRSTPGPHRTRNEPRRWRKPELGGAFLALRLAVHRRESRFWIDENGPDPTASSDGENSLWFIDTLSGADVRLLWVSREGRVLESVGPVFHPSSWVSLSPDGEYRLRRSEESARGAWADVLGS